MTLYHPPTNHNINKVDAMKMPMRHGLKSIPIGAGLLLLLMLSAATLASAETLISDIGVRGGGSDGKNSEDFSFIEIFARGMLPWSWSPSDRWRLDSYLEAGLGALDDGGKTGLVASIGPLAVLSRADSRWQLELGVKPTWLSKDRFGRDDLGGHFHFTSHIGMNYRFSPRLRLGYRFQHTSNANITDTNPGLDVHLLMVDWRFD